MTIGFLFWLLMVLCLVFGLAVAWPRQAPYYVLGGSLLWWVLLFCLGYAVFGSPIRV